MASGQLEPLMHARPVGMERDDGDGTEFDVYLSAVVTTTSTFEFMMRQLPLTTFLEPSLISREASRCPSESQ